MTLQLLPYQRVGAAHLASNALTGLFDEPGVGKTAQAIAALDAGNLKRVLIVCPAAVRAVWVGEFKKFATVERKILKGKTPHDFKHWLTGKSDVLVASYEMATRWSSHFADCFDAIILDESHYLKSPGAQRTRAMLGTHCRGSSGAARWAERAWFLTGTPAPNSPSDIWTFLSYVGGTKLTFGGFTAYFFKETATTFGSRYSLRQDRAAELKQLIQANSLRRTKEEAGLNLPPIWLTDITVDGDMDDVRKTMTEHPGLDKAIIEALDRGGLSFLDSQHIMTLRRLIAEAKAPAYAAILLDELLMGRGKVVVMGWHTKPLKLIQEVLTQARIKSVMLTGENSESQRVEAVRAFQNDADCQVFLGNIRAAGTGLTLTASCEIDMFESSWTPADNAQALMRVHRIGQNNTVRGRFITLADSIDEHVQATVLRKVASIAGTGINMLAHVGA